MASENKTVADILAEMRREIGDGTDTYCGKRIIRRMGDDRVRQYCDRIEAAWKREREELDKRFSDLEAYAKLWTGRADELRLKCDEFYAKAKSVGNAAAMREALLKCREIALQWQADEADGVAGTTDKPQARSAAEAVIDMEFEINAALSAPPRNCDVGTAEEQAERFARYCGTEVCKRKRCKTRPKALVIDSCALCWAQMPYEAKEGGAK